MIDPTTGEIIPDPPPAQPKQATYTVSQFHTEMAIGRMARMESLDALIAIKDKCKSLGLIKSHESKLREAFAYNYRRIQRIEKKGKGNEDEK